MLFRQFMIRYLFRERREGVDVADELLTVPQILAELGGLSRRTFYRWRELGTGPSCMRLPNGELRVWRSDFRRWLDSLSERSR